MGFSFLRIEEELASERFTSLYRRLQEECPHLVAYPSATALIAFFNDVEKEYAEKDALLSFLITVYRRDGPGRLLSGLFIILFRPAIASLYRLARKSNFRLDEEDFIQDVCTLLLEIIATAPVRPQKVAMQIVGPLRNRVRSLLNREIAGGRLTTFGSATLDGDNPMPIGHGNHKGDVEIEKTWDIAAAPDGNHDDVWDGNYGDEMPSSYPGRMTVLPQGEQGEQGDQGEENATGEWRRYDLTDAESFLTGLVAMGVIGAEDREIIYETVIKERPFKDLATDPKEYQRLKKRRQRCLAAIRKYLRNIPK
ncbi:MAG TPA: hypothetical protein PLU95_06535 [Syntrophales bacterium]|nr:hypothetical protein [Syntrophales bacterium]HOD98197.1 hypothetical protein [Syntrophales bacterium]HOH73663.1 hypothetical protein [Syntrophales bacterium]HPN08941.1 hypothetical protein [Syntrophales bacterium]HPX80587.1 hypothetical protein [Syntrophales bacterium]